MAISAVIHNDFPRMAPEALAAWRSIPSCVASDAMNGQGVLDYRFKPLWPGARLCGPALPVRTHPGENAIVMKALDLARPGDVLVIDGGEHCNYALIGGNVALWATMKGVGGALVAGGVRDIGEIQAAGFPVIGLGMTPRQPGKAEGGTIGLPVAVGGVPVGAGDLVIGDEDGVVIIPRSELDAALPRALAKDVKDADVRKRVQGGASMYIIQGMDKVFG